MAIRSGCVLCITVPAAAPEVAPGGYVITESSGKMQNVTIYWKVKQHTSITIIMVSSQMKLDGFGNRSCSDTQ